MKNADEVRMFLVDTANDMIEEEMVELADDLRTLAKNLELGGSQTERELVALLSDYVGETGESESAVEVLSRLLAELEGYRRGRLATDIKCYVSAGKRDAYGFSAYFSPQYDHVPGAIIQRMIDEERVR